MALPERLKFGIFLAPFHPTDENPTLALHRDMELLEWLDYLGFDEAWVGEHHSAGWETISSPEVFIAAAAERTRHIKLGTGVISLPYHHPFMVANRMVQLDHMTRGRVMLGVGPGALVTDAYMLGIDSAVQRERMDESLGMVLRLMTETDPITYDGGWFQLNEALLQLRPYTKPHMPVAVASVLSPSGVALAGKHGAAVLSLIVSRDRLGFTDLAPLWSIAEESAAEHGQTVNRDDWRIVIPTHIAESREEAIEDVRKGGGRIQRKYFEETLGRLPDDPEPMDKIVDTMVETGSWVVGTPDDCVDAIKRLEQESGGFGAYLVQTFDWAPREKLLKSYELMARYVMPKFQNSLVGIETSNEWARERSPVLTEMRTRAIDRAKETYAQRRVT